MRPGRLTPENLGIPRPKGGENPRFNEAGAINPGKPGGYGRSKFKVNWLQ